MPATASQEAKEASKEETALDARLQARRAMPVNAGLDTPEDRKPLKRTRPDSVYAHSHSNLEGNPGLDTSPDRKKPGRKPNSNYMLLVPKSEPDVTPPVPIGMFEGPRSDSQELAKFREMSTHHPDGIFGIKVEGSNPAMNAALKYELIASKIEPDINRPFPAGGFGELANFPNMSTHNSDVKGKASGMYSGTAAEISASSQDHGYGTGVLGPPPAQHQSIYYTHGHNGSYQGPPYSYQAIYDEHAQDLRTMNHAPVQQPHSTDPHIANPLIPFQMLNAAYAQWSNTQQSHEPAIAPQTSHPQNSKTKDPEPKKSYTRQRRDPTEAWKWIQDPLPIKLGANASGGDPAASSSTAAAGSATTDAARKRGGKEFVFVREEPEREGYLERYEE